MKKLIIALMALSAFSISPVFAQEGCNTIEDGMKKYGLNQDSLLLKDRAEESLYYYFLLPKPVEGNNYIMLETVGECLTDFHEYISDEDFYKLKEADAIDKSRRVVKDDDDVDTDEGLGEGE